ncbi:nucleic acid-binding, OB-fold protein [Artemisia annua]|uniref:Nucleic acid-binding, OB-fold protein n=1 Tax=Artemisia annua TaxID=35608 RepID=A0A2U1ML72_ARTAN|nr:nucleic acid-binding, OB-fold protein [Artemisia annua]
MALTVDPATSEKNAEAPVIPSRQLAYLTELSPADNSKFIEVRVYRKWTAVKIPGFTPISFSCILLDKKGSAIQANADLKEKARFEHELQINSVYKIQGFGFEKADGWGKTLDNDFTLSFGKYTQIQQLSDTDFPYHYFNFAAFNELNARLEKKNPILTGDYIGYVHNVDKVNEYGGATTTRVKVRNIGIRNLNNDVVPFTLWNDDAENFKEAEYAQMKQPVILAVNSCYLNRFADGNRSNITATILLQLILANSYKYRYNEANASGGHIQVQTQRLTSWEQERNRNRVPLGTLLQIDPKTQQRVLFTQEATILHIDTNHHWYYQKCDECGGKLTYGYLHGQCHQYGTKTNPQNSYCFRIVITDGTGNAVVSCFTPQTDGLIKDVNTLLQEVENKDPTTIPPAILALQNTRHIFQFQFAAPTAKGPTTFVLKKIMDEPQATLPTSSASPSSPPVVPMTVNAGEEYTPPPATPTVTQDTPADVPTITIPPHDPSAKKNYSQHPPVKNVVQPQRNTRKNRVSTILLVAKFSGYALNQINSSTPYSVRNELDIKAPENRNIVSINK